MKYKGISKMVIEKKGNNTSGYFIKVSFHKGGKKKVKEITDIMDIMTELKSFNNF